MNLKLKSNTNKTLKYNKKLKVNSVLFYSAAMKLQILLLAVTSSCLADDLTLTISDGQVKGTQKWSNAGNSYYAFYSIPYAQPPTGSLRFQAPVAVHSWKGLRDATAEGNICYQVNYDYDDENEDCLTVNVYTPKNPNQIASKLPVLFYIHGGAFNWGSGHSNGNASGIAPDYFMDTNNVVLVTVNYRLGPFGFFSTGDSVIPGNAGLKDQRLALKWTQNNVATFGGDPTKVTIFGESAGAASVGYHILSPASAGLFSGAILSSGTPLCPWAFQRNQTEITYKTASFINSQFDSKRDSRALFDYLQTVDAKDIDTASKSYSDWAQSYSQTGFNGVINGQLQQGFFYAPVVEEVANADAFLNDNPYEILASGNINKVPTLIGACDEEGLMNLNDNLQWTLSVYDEYPSYLVPQNMHIKNESTQQLVGQAIKEEYSPKGDMQNNLLSGIQYFTDQDFKKSLIKHAELQSNYTDVYFYVFTYSGQMGENTIRYPGTSNVTHTEEGNYIWQRSNAANYPQADQTVHKRFVKIWTNFVMYQNPTPLQDADLQDIIWPKLREDNLHYVDIGADLTVKSNPNDKYAFWKSLYEAYGVAPYDTY